MNETKHVCVSVWVRLQLYGAKKVDDILCDWDNIKPISR